MVIYSHHLGVFLSLFRSDCACAAGSRGELAWWHGCSLIQLCCQVYWQWVNLTPISRHPGCGIRVDSEVLVFCRIGATCTGLMVCRY
ncbi:hypothetical protein KC19_4G235800 [Ceratodon purpureus]|uniref:Secreted protein n=1 Tax=Ceratodon purpureus TaxID=3225 RepID=A0A8T0IBX7_CERPU|nr:hypothetical protein KC19_4G235800 [Ceratodon purpureus]